MRRLPLFLAVILLAGCSAGPQLQRDAPEALSYRVDLNDRSGDTFKVTLSVEDLGAANAVYQFASTAPGTYQVMDMGRFVRSFTARDADGSEIASEQVSTNQWRISDPEAVTIIEYAIAETWDTPVEENAIYMMCGTSIEDDHAQINGQAVFGYPTGMQGRPLRITIDRPEDWLVGTALPMDASGAWLAEDYDHVVDSPILLGTLSVATLEVAGADIGIYTYSKSGSIESAAILNAVRDILEASGEFLGELPVDRYAFLFHFEDVNMGAWEHSYSSTYTYAEADFPMLIQQSIPSVVAHEFLHIVTPLNIHSEIIEQFNFVTPTPSEHVWLYEGTTEWMAQMSQFRGGLIGLDEYLARISGKLQANDSFDGEFSLSDISLQSYSQKGQQQWGNIYQRGAVVAGLLDIEILSRSGGERGLREVLLDLSERYGPDTAFDEASFFDEVSEMAYPGARDFFERYVRDTQPLPIADTYGKLGISYQEAVPTGEMQASLGIQVGLSGDRLMVSKAGAVAVECGIQDGDLLLAYNDTEITLQSVQQVFGQLHGLEPGVSFDMTLGRGDEELTVPCAKQLVEQIDRHVLTADPDASAEQIALRDAWARNLD